MSFQFGHRVERRPVIGILGCMAERLKTQLLEKEHAIDLVVGPDAYRDLPRLLAAVQVQLRAYSILILCSALCHQILLIAGDW